MQKLFDLMLMAIKYQTQMAVQPEEIYHNVIMHLDTMFELIKGTTAEANIMDAKVKMVDMCSKFSPYDFIMVRQYMYKFFEGRHIKVSLFISDKIQGLDGTIYLDFSGNAPFGSIKPGTVIQHDPSTG